MCSLADGSRAVSVAGIICRGNLTRTGEHVSEYVSVSRTCGTALLYKRQGAPSYGFRLLTAEYCSVLLHQFPFVYGLLLPLLICLCVLTYFCPVPHFLHITQGEAEAFLQQSP